MQTLDASAPLATLPENQRVALLSLLADEDPEIYRLVRSKLISFGAAACDWLRPLALSSDPRTRRRAQEILTHHARQSGDRRFLEFCRTSEHDLDLEKAVALLAQTKYPHINSEAYTALYDSWAIELESRLDRTGPAAEMLVAINRFLFEELGFAGDERYGCEPDCSYINRIVDTRRGNPIGLCAIYLFLARRLRLPISGIGMPGHFVCRYQSSTAEIYIDCFRKGLFLTRADCIKYLLQSNYGLGEGHLAPVSSRRILHRMCNNLMTSYGHLEETEEAARVQRYAAALARLE